MKYSFLFLLFPLTLFGQRPRYGGAFDYQLDATPYQGLHFKLTAAVRAQCLGNSAGAALWVRVDRPDHDVLFFDGMKDRPIRDSVWKVYSIEGEVGKDAKWLMFGGSCFSKGYFYFDDFHLYLQTPGSKWDEISLSDGGFEEDSSRFNHNWYFYRKAHFFVPFLTTDRPYEGKQAIKIDGTQPFDPQYYGTNDSTGHFIRANGIRLYYEIYGKGEPLLLLHGNSSSIVSFEKQIPELSKHYRVIAVDSRGQGRSGEDGKTYSYDLFAEDMNAFLDSLHLDSVNVLGWSDGGNTGLIMAMKYPGKVRRLATMGANIFIDKTVVYPWVYKLMGKIREELVGDTTAWARNRGRLLTMLYTEPRHRFDELPSISCPVLVMAGEKDVIRDQHTRQIAAHIPHSQLVIFPGGTHTEPSDHPEVFNKTVEDFLDVPASNKP
jgi:pimeloyl-ACP methyl ester carboxylesterase